jgi:tRNA-2-methylthio-N6-dimethylallyladenosine synthase
VLLEAQAALMYARRRALVGRELEVLVEGLSKRDPERFTGRTDRNLIVCCPHRGEDLAGRLVRVRIEDCTPLTLFGERVGPSGG